MTYIRKTLAILAAIAATTMTVGCSSNEDDVPSTISSEEDKAWPIVLETGLQDAVVVRAERQSTNIVSGRKVYVWANYYNTATKWFGAWETTSNGSGGLTSSTTKYYPKDNGKVDIFAIHGNNTFTNNADFPGAYTHTVSTDQTNATNYYNSDLIFGALKNRSHQTAAAQIPMYHLLSKLRFVLKSGSTLINDNTLGSATVNLQNVRTAVTFTPSRTIDVGNATSRAGMLSTQSTTGTIKVPAVSYPRTSSGFGSNYGEIIVPPQNVTATLQVTVTTTANQTLTLTTPVTINVSSGNAYIYQVTVTAEQLSVSNITLQGWGNGDSMSSNI